MELKNLITKACSDVKFNEPMKNHTTFKIGGVADIFCEPSGEKELKELIKILRDKNIPYTVIGNGSNLLVSDKGIRGAVIKIGDKMNKIEVRGTQIHADAGAILSKISNTAMKESLTGFECLSGIPGSFGGAIYMNAGAYGAEISQILSEATAISPDGEIITLKNEQMDFGYRQSIFMKKNYIITSGVITLQEGNKEEIIEKIKDITKRRNEKQPLNLPSAGSTFKRPQGHFAGKLIEDCGLKGFSIGGAKVSEKHAGFIVNYNNATAQDVISLIKHVQAEVLKKFNVKIEPEVKLIGEEMD